MRIMGDFVQDSTKFHKSLLDAEELLKSTSKPSVLPYTGSDKDIKPGSSSEQKINVFYDELSTVLDEERVCKMNSLSIGTWEEERKMIRMQQICGSHWQRFGTMINNCMHLNVGEGLFLLDQGLLEIYHNGLPLSFQQAWSLLTQYLPSMEYYLAYSYLARIGFAVKSSVEIDNVKYGEKKQTDIKRSGKVDDEAHSLLYATKGSTTDAFEEEKLPAFSVIRKFETGRDGSSFELNDSSDLCGIVTIESSKINVLCQNPENINENTEVTARNIVQKNSLSINDAVVDHTLKANQPLVCPLDAKSTASLLSKLQIIKRRDVGKINASNSSLEKSHFLNVYQKTSNFKKSKPGPPDYKVAVLKNTEPPPNHNELEIMMKDAGEVPLKLAVSNRGTTNFYALMNVDVSKTLSLNDS